MVRAWYQATTMWMQWQEQRDPQHLEAGLRLFPEDPLLLFLSGCEHEAYASPVIQVPIQGTPRDTWLVRSPRDELQQAADQFRKSLANGSSAETRLHLGRVEQLLGDPQEAVQTLNAADALPSDTLRYLRDLFLGQAYEESGAFADAGAAYERAHALFPLAQSPLLAMSQLRRRSDDYEQAKAAMTALWTVVPDNDEDDPWWRYSVSHTDGAEARVESVWRSVE